MTLRPAPLLRQPGQYRGMSAFTGLRKSRGRDPGLPDVPVPAAGAVSRAADEPLAEEDWSATDPYASPRAQLIRRIIFLVFISYFVMEPLFTRSWHRASPLGLFLLAGTVVFTVLVFWVFSGGYRWDQEQARRVVWLWLPAALTLGIALFVVGDLDTGTRNTGNWVVVLTVAAAVCGRYTRSAAGRDRRRHVHGCGPGRRRRRALEPGRAGLRGDHAPAGHVPGLYRGQADGDRRHAAPDPGRAGPHRRGRGAAADRRDLHDLLGHSLSLITLKAELSRRMMSTDAERAGRELAELEAVARQSLSDVREAVAGYRQPDLAAELGAARQLLTAAGITCGLARRRRSACPARWTPRWPGRSGKA